MTAEIIARHYAAADAARASNRPAAAAQHFEAVLALDANQARALNGLGLGKLAAGDARAAAQLFARATTVAPGAIELWLNRASAERAVRDDGAELASLDAALAIEPYAVVALLHKAQNFERRGDLATAARNYQAVLSIIGSAKPPPALAAALVHGREVIAAEQARLGETLVSYVGDRAGLVAGAAARRFDRCIDLLLGRAAIFPSTPTGLFYPGLPLVEFFEREDFPWLARLEAATSMIQREFAQLTGDFLPYVDMPSGVPVNQWAALNGSLDWNVRFLWKDGVRDEDTCSRCPETAALLDELPLLDMPGRGPAAFFSVLRPGAHIPPHVGATNIRTVVHLPLVVPPHCGLRVGGEVREWQIGTALAFDDTIEHEAWNRSDQPRAVLIVDAWNPGLSEGERMLLRALTRGMDAHAAAR